MHWSKIIEFPGDSDLAGLDAYLNQNRIPHRITEEGSKLVLWLADPRHRSVVDSYLQQPHAHQAPQPEEAPPGKRRDGLSLDQIVNLFPLTLLTIILGTIGWVYIEFIYTRNSAGVFFFAPFGQALATGEWWRTFSPTFLHFSILHVVFNCLWVWELGRRIEVFAGKWFYFWLFIFSGLSANYLQYYMGADNPFAVFGGLSGVVYAYLGYLLIWNRVSNHPLLKMPSGIFIFMLVWLALGFFGLLDFFVPGKIANGAHLGGLLCGIAFACAQWFWQKNKNTLI